MPIEARLRLARGRTRPALENIETGQPVPDLDPTQHPYYARAASDSEHWRAYQSNVRMPSGWGRGQSSSSNDRGRGRGRGQGRNRNYNRPY